MVKTRSLALNRCRVVTARRRTDRIAIANTRSQQYLPVQLSRVKTVLTSACRRISFVAMRQCHSIVLCGKFKHLKKITETQLA